MATTVEMPKLGNTVEDCLISTWLKHEGDMVAAGDVIVEIETDKTSFEITAPVGGVILATFFPEGALVPVFTSICAIGSPGETLEGIGPGPAGPAGEPPVVGPAPTANGQALSAGPEQAPPSALETSAGDGAAPVSPRARRFARQHELEVGNVKGSGPGGRVLEEDLRAVLYARPAPGPTEEPGPALAAAGQRVAEPAAAPSATAVTTGQVQEPAAAEGKPLSLARQKIASRLRESLASTAQYTLHGSANAAGLLAVRRRLKASSATAEVNINYLVAYCTMLALVDTPDVNALLVDGVLYRHADVNLAFACDTVRGLMVPVVRRAQDLSLLGLSRRLKELVAQAEAGTISVDDLNGGTFTVSNMGGLGVESFTPVLNPPQVGILGVGAIGLKASRKADGNIEFIDSISLSLTFDHQAVDGAPGARFLKVVQGKIENAEALCTT
ncbi:MAG TPA: dihydrolipoamide acetyltransferase family protein [Acidimicrobiales bacterium]|nr:dihydrolipoamide acetyltransferase family protein [Acidimicrobiales bacterium]